MVKENSNIDRKAKPCSWKFDVYICIYIFLFFIFFIFFHFFFFTTKMIKIYPVVSIVQPQLVPLPQSWSQHPIMYVVQVYQYGTLRSPTYTRSLYFFSVNTPGLLRGDVATASLKTNPIRNPYSTPEKRRSGA